MAKEDFWIEWKLTFYQGKHQRLVITIYSGLQFSHNDNFVKATIQLLLQFIHDYNLIIITI